MRGALILGLFSLLAACSTVGGAGVRGTVAGRGEDWATRVAMAAEALDSGRAKVLLEKWIDLAV
ncbi:MAG: hypothetical protein ACOVQ6_15010 [Brevundimonas sp.]